MSEKHPDDALREELVLLRAAVARELRKQLDAGQPTPALLEAARKFLGDQLKPEAPRKAPPVSRNLPFQPDEA